MTLIRKCLRSGGILLACFAAVACVTMSAGSDYYAAADFSEYRSYAWMAASPLIQSRSNRVEVSPLHVRRIREAIERAMAAKGFELAATRDAADFAISFTVGARDMIEIDDYPLVYRRRWRWGPPYFYPNVDVAMYTEGMLAIDVFDNATREPVWHGWARKRIVGADVRDPESAIDAAVAAILADFPPTARR